MSRVAAVMSVVCFLYCGGEGTMIPDGESDEDAPSCTPPEEYFADQGRCIWPCEAATTESSEVCPDDRPLCNGHHCVACYTVRYHFRSAPDFQECVADQVGCAENEWCAGEMCAPRENGRCVCDAHCKQGEWCSRNLQSCVNQCPAPASGQDC